MATPIVVADFETQLSTAVAAGATTFSVASATDDDGVALPTGRYYFTVDGSSSQKEYLAGTLTGTSVTSVVSVSRQGVEKSGAARAHRVGATVVLTDFATYKKYIDVISIQGAANASESTLGITKLSVAAASPSNPIAVGDNDTRVPTVSGAAFVNATTGMVSMFAGTSVPTGFLACDGSAVSRTTHASLFTAIGTSWGSGDGSTTFNVPDLRGCVPVGAGTKTKVATFASRASNVITVTGLSNAANNEFQTGQLVNYVTTGTPITGLTTATNYYLVRTGNLTFSLATSLANAQNGTVITLSGDGSGTQTFTLTLTARTAGQTGGEESHAMSLSELLLHNHTTGDINSGGPESKAITSSTDSGDVNQGANSNLMRSAGGNAAMNNMQPFGVITYIIKT